ncbi:amidohydrolase family protein [Streptomyces sp. NPDC008343]|uniref:amidohydrolase family protein n=1 Tax=Streptomyces sp. NPDC008343 TaxID=3364828 RepID=UPI0036F0E9B2
MRNGPAPRETRATHETQEALKVRRGAVVMGRLSRLSRVSRVSRFYFDTALSSSPAALPTLLAFARPGHVLFGSDWPFAPTPAGQYFASGLDSGVDPGTLTAINRTNAEALFPRLAGGTPAPTSPRPLPARLRQSARRAAARLVFKLLQPGTD